MRLFKLRGTPADILQEDNATMRCISFLVICLTTLLAACSATGNDERAHFVKQGPNYVVEMKGRRRLMAHDPISAIRGRTYEETLTITLPRIDGVIDGTEITPKPGYLPYVGRVVIAAGKMTVDLYYDDRDARTRVALLWNGEYILVQRATP